MKHADHVRLLSDGVGESGGTWADFGCGDGAFTLALAELLGRNGEIHAVDSNGAALARLKGSMAARFPKVRLTTYQADFRAPIELPHLDGLVAANALHFLPQKDVTVRLLRDYLMPGGRFLIVEYATDRGNRWVPYPFTFGRWQIIAGRCGLIQTELLAEAPSSFLGGIYSAQSRRP